MIIQQNSSKPQDRINNRHVISNKEKKESRQKKNTSTND
jgi:hypothetical protein